MYIDKLLETNPFDFSESNKELFRKSMAESFIIHTNGNQYIDHISNKQGFDISMVNTEKELESIPYLMINLLKFHSFLSVDTSKIALTLTSSGTGGQKSQIMLDDGSLSRVKKSAFNIYSALGIVDDNKYNYLCFTYDPQVADDLGTAFTDELLTNMTQKAEVFYTFKFNKVLNDFEFDEKATAEKLVEFSKSDYPLRILGFPAHLYFLINKYDINLDLGSNAWLQTGGGWKNQDDSQIDKKEFRSFIHKRLGIRPEHNRDLFGMVEHGIAYVDDISGNLRVPNYSRVFIRDPKTLSCLGYDEVGLIQFMCSYNHSYASFNVLSTDWGYLTKHADGGDIIHITGRAGVNKHKGCAIKANALMDI
jgi:hypothetical protein